MKRAIKVFGLGTLCLPSLVIGLLVMIGYFDISERSYKTRADAVRDRFFDRGWLPAFIPHSARNFSVTNNLDVNTSMGSFDFDPSDLTAFTDAIRASNDGSSRNRASDLRVQELKRAGYQDYDFSDRGACWRFLICSEQGRCEYWASVNHTRN